MVKGIDEPQLAKFKDHPVLGTGASFHSKSFVRNRQIVISKTIRDAIVNIELALDTFIETHQHRIKDITPEYQQWMIDAIEEIQKDKKEIVALIEEVYDNTEIPLYQQLSLIHTLFVDYRYKYKELYATAQRFKGGLKPDDLKPIADDLWKLSKLCEDISNSFVNEITNNIIYLVEKFYKPSNTNPGEGRVDLTDTTFSRLVQTKHVACTEEGIKIIPASINTSFSPTIYMLIDRDDMAPQNDYKFHFSLHPSPQNLAKAWDIALKYFSKYETICSMKIIHPALAASEMQPGKHMVMYFVDLMDPNPHTQAKNHAGIKAIIEEMVREWQENDIKCGEEKPEGGIDLNGQGYAFSSGLTHQADGQYIFAKDRPENLNETNAFMNANVLNHEALSQVKIDICHIINELRNTQFPKTYLVGLSIRGRLKNLLEQISGLVERTEQDPVNITYDLKELIRTAHLLIEKSPTARFCSSAKRQRLSSALDDCYKKLDKVHNECRDRARYRAQVLLQKDIEERKARGEPIYLIDDSVVPDSDTQRLRDGLPTVLEEPEDNYHIDNEKQPPSVTPTVLPPKMNQSSFFITNTDISALTSYRELIEQKLQRIKSDPEDYAKQLTKLYQEVASSLNQLLSDIDIDPLVEVKVLQLINQTNQLNESGEVQAEALIRVLTNTHDLLTNRMSAEQYMSEATTLEKQTSTAMKDIGGNMKSLGIAMMALGIVALVSSIFMPLTGLAFMFTVGVVVTALPLTLGGAYLYFKEDNKENIYTNKADISHQMKDITDAMPSPKV